ncbi:MAG: hypothetical protein M3Z46_13475 [Actinomycetota bacterium]|nr:hypothetical protein [Actinomycetota bacterium]
MFPTPLGLWIGLIVGLAFVTDGFSGVLLVAVFGAAGWFVEKLVRGEIDLGDRTSSGSDT